MSDRDLPREQKTADDFTISLGAHRFDPADAPTRPAHHRAARRTDAAAGGAAADAPAGPDPADTRIVQFAQALGAEDIARIREQYGLALTAYVPAQRVETDFGDGQLLYRLATDVPFHWFPFVPVRAAGVAPTAGVVQLERRPLVRILADGSSFAPEPRGRILTDAVPLRIEEEEVPRSGTDVIRSYQLARWIDGRYLLWSGRQRKTGGGEGSSGLRFDAVGPAVR